MSREERYREHGYEICALNHAPTRNGLWARFGGGLQVETVEEFKQLLDRIELCSGRSGSDEYIELKVGQVLTQDQIFQLYKVLQEAIVALGLAMENPATFAHFGALYVERFNACIDLAEQLAVTKKQLDDRTKQLGAEQVKSTQLRRELDQLQGKKR